MKNVGECKTCKYLKREVVNGLGTIYICTGDDRYPNREIPYEWLDELTCNNYVYRKQNKLG